MRSRRLLAVATCVLLVVAGCSLPPDRTASGSHPAPVAETGLLPT